MHNPKNLLDETYQQALLQRKGVGLLLEEYQLQEDARRQVQHQHQSLLAQKNALAKNLSPTAPDFEVKKIQGQALRQAIGVLEDKVNEILLKQKNINLALPNVPAADVPLGRDENDNKVIKQWGSPKEQPFDHVSVGEKFGLDIEAGVALAKSRFSVLRGPAAKLHRALANLMLDMHEQAGYEECSVPLLVNAQTMEGTGQLPKFEEDLFKTEELYLIPTAEVPLTNLVAHKVIDNLPQKLMAYTACFRQEAGAAGRDTRGILRQHQFDKVELVRIESPECSNRAHQEMLAQSCSVLEALELPYRVVELCVGDLGFSAQKTYDIEVWMPSEKKYREIASISNCGDFQARRMNAKTANKKFVHTLNGSGVAVGRALVAFFENHINPDQSLYIPKALRGFIGAEVLFPTDPPKKVQSCAL